MIPMDVVRLAEAVEGRPFVGSDADGALMAGAEVTHVMTDSRVDPDGPAVFFALRTPHGDGHDHVMAAAASGARMAVVDRPVVGAPLVQVVVDDTWAAIARLGRHVVDTVGCRVVAITGSYGKTTVKDLAAAALARGRVVAASRGSFNNELGVPLTMLGVAVGSEVLVAEAGARNAGDIADLGRLLRPDVAVVTAVGPVHLETFGTEDGVAIEKGRLVESLGATGTAVLNADDHRVAAMARLAPAAITVSVRLASADVTASGMTVDADGRARADVRTPWGSTSIVLPVPGVHHLTNGLIALTVAGLEGVDIEAAAGGIAEARMSPSRSALHRIAGVTVLDDAYNASPPTVLGALETLAALPCTGKRWAVLGVMAELGASSYEAHVAVGRACASAVDELVVVGDAAGIVEGARSAAGHVRVRVVADHDEAAEVVIEDLSEGDAVLFKASRVATLDRAAARLLAALGEGIGA
jgi:UDP-N-acetylmuramoyl-tripeptide--D-alanyl-D-alanine ligase